MIGLYSVNLRIMGQANLSLLNETTLFSQLEGIFESLSLDAVFFAPYEWLGLGAYTPRTFYAIVMMLLVVFVVKKLLDFFLRTETGLALRATGDNQTMVRSFSANTNVYIILGIGLANALVALSGALVVQYNGFADVNLGVGMIVVGLASVIIGEVLFGKKTIVRTTFAIICGAIVYRAIYAMALRVDFLEASDMKLITALIVVAALVVPNMLQKSSEKRQFKKSQKALTRVKQQKGEVQVANVKSNS